MVNREFEKNLAKKLNSSPYEVKTTSAAILERFHSIDGAAKKRNGGFSSLSRFQKWLAGGLGALATAAIALAIYFPVKQALTPTETDFPDAIIEEPTLTNVGKKTGAIAYEVSSLIDRFISNGADASAESMIKRKNSLSEDGFATAVEVYDNMQASIAGALNEDALSSVGLSRGAFAGVYGEYPYELTFGSGGRFLFNLDVDDEMSDSSNSSFGGIKKTRDFDGEVALSSGEAYLASGTRTIRLGNRSNITILVYLDEAKTSYFEVEQNTTKGSFFFSFSRYASSSFDFGYSVHLVKATLSGESTPRLMVATQYTRAEDWASFKFRIIAGGNDAYVIYLSGLSSPISLIYDGSKRRYTYGSYAIEK